MKKHYRPYSGIFLPVVVLVLLGLISCEADDLSQPVRVHFELSYVQDTAPLEYLTFRQIAVDVEQISFLGIRQEGNDVLFNTRPGETFGMHILSPEQNSSYITYFDLPQGVYQQMRWDVELAEMDEDVFPDDYIDSDDFGFIIEGTYTRQDGTSMLLFIALEEEELIRVESINQQGEMPIPILAENTYSVFLEINPHALMSGIPRSMLEQAEEDEEDDIEFIEISEDENEELYNLVLFQLSKTLRAVVR
ncbi:MAG: hypothetical protein ACOCYD_01635 [bacterium]